MVYVWTQWTVFGGLWYRQCVSGGVYIGYVWYDGCVFGVDNVRG